MAEYIIEMKNITKIFPGIVANDNVTIQIKKGEIYALLGENGAGKSTLMGMLFGMYEPDKGEIFVRGKKETICSPKHATKLNIGMVHQHFKLVSDFTITENIIMGIEPIKKFMGVFPYINMKECNKKIEKLSKQYGLEVNPTKRINEINVSTQQRVEILKMLYREAEILIFDEPTAVLTPQEIEFLLEIIKGLKEAGKTIILITHKLEEIKKVADRCAIFCKGKLIDVLDVATTSAKEMANKMVGREVSFEVEKPEARYSKEILSVQNLTVKDDNGFPVVKNASFTIRGGEILVIAGVSGNGQVELADTIVGLLPATEGKIILKGKDITHRSIRNRIDAGIAYIPEDRQKYGLVLDFQLEENFSLKSYYQQPFSKNGILQKKEFTTFGEKLIEQYDIRSGQGNKTVVRSMSGGNQQKAIIAREVEKNADLIIFVQPTRGLDIGAIENIHKQIIAEREKGKAILLISLELDEVMNLADTIAVIYNGEILKVADAKNLSVKQVGEFMMGVTGNAAKQ